MEHGPAGPEDELFHVAVPPPGLPHAPGAPDVVFFRSTQPAPPDARREHEDIMLRRVPAETARRFRAAAGGRGMTHAQYLGALVALHESMRHRADGGDQAVAAELERLGLTSVTL
jgi:hypothetical protein